MEQKNKKCTDENMLLDINMSNVFVVKNSKKRAFIEQFNYSSVNFTQKDLGTILGFFVVRDNTPSSENIVNFLASEVKKKYFSPIESSTEDKFESTLHHINRVLEEIANIGNVQWLGNIDSAICVIAESSIYFSVTGNAHIFLLRDNVLTNISEGIASSEASEYPLKTFVDISSGDLCPYDKIIITSQELLDFISFEELQKNAINFGQQNFIQFIETVLTNECSIATTTIIDLNQKENKIFKNKTPDTKSIPKNLFGADAFEKEITNKKTFEAINANELPEEQPSEYTNPRTGHIHIQGNDEPIEKQTLFEQLLEKLADISEFLKLKTKAHIKTISSLRDKQNKSIHKTSEPIIDTTEDFSTVLDDLDYPKEESISFFQNILPTSRQFYAKISSIIKKISNKFIILFKNNLTKKNKDNLTNEQAINTKKSLLPNFHRIKKLWNDMNIQTKLITIGILIMIVIVPMIFSITSNKNDDENLTEQNEETVAFKEPAQQVENTKNTDLQTNTASDPTILLENNSLVSTILMNNNQFGISKNELIILTDKKTDAYKIPTDAGEIKFATPMKDLDLIFFITSNNKIFSFSPTTKKFTEQKNIPQINVSEITTLGSYLTYLYTTNSTMIQRYAREENGFAPSENWLTKNENLNSATSLAIDADIYITLNGKISKFLKHKKIPFSQDSSIKNANLVYTSPITKNLWILDTKNGILFKTSKESGKKIEEFNHTEFNNATSLTINEKTNTAIISTPAKILSFKL